MVTEFAKEMIKNADSCGAQDIYVIPRQDNYELYMRVGQERRLIDVYRPDFMASLIGHFKFVAGMMVGEKRRSQLGSCDYDCGDGQRVSLRLSTVGDYRGLESLVIRVLHSERRELVYWNQGIQPIMDALDYRGLYLFAGPVGSGKTTLMHELVQERFKGQQAGNRQECVHELSHKTGNQAKSRDQCRLGFSDLIDQTDGVLDQSCFHQARTDDRHSEHDDYVCVGQSGQCLGRRKDVQQDQRDNYAAAHHAIAELAAEKRNKHDQQN